MRQESTVDAAVSIRPGAATVWRGNVWPTLGALAASLIATVATTVALVATILAAAHRTHAAPLIVAALTAIAAGFVAGTVTDRLSRVIQDRVEGRLERVVWQRMLDADPPFLLTRPLRALIGWSSSVAMVRSLLGTLGADALLGGFIVTLGSLALFAVDSAVGFVSLGIGASILAVAGVTGWRQQRHDRTVFDRVDDIQALLHPAVGGIDELAGYGAQGLIVDRWWDRFAEQKNADASGLRWAAPGEALLGTAAPVLITTLCATVVWRGGPDVMFHLVLVVLISGQVATGWSRMAATLPGLFAIGLARHRLASLLAAGPEPTGSPAQRLDGGLQLEHLQFTYPDSAEPVLHDVSIQVEPGECVALVGTSGSGKSTILRLILGLHRPSAGQIRFDGADQVGLDVSTIRRQIGYVPQAGSLLRGCLRDVILGAETDRGDAETVWSAAERSGIADDIRAMPMGLDTRVSDTRASFSGGQIQRLLLARALYRQPRILLLDEATSALDTSTEASVTQSISSLDITRIVVAHRLSTIQGADRVVLIEGGRVAAIGSYTQLLRNEPAFRDLVADMPESESNTPSVKEFS